MPTRFEFDLRVTRPGLVVVDHVHACLCEALEGPLGLEHAAASKRFSAGMLLQHPQDPDSVRLVVNWLADRLRVERQVLDLDVVRFGSLLAEVTSVRTSRTTYRALTHSPPTTRALWSFNSPTAFALSGRRRGLLPDPFLIFTGLARRWNDVVEDFELHVDSVAVRALVDRLRITDVRLSTQALPARASDPNHAGRVHDRPGFVGLVDFRLPEGDVENGALLARLSRFAEFAGVGTQTTMGFGSVAVELGRAAP